MISGRGSSGSSAASFWMASRAPGVSRAGTATSTVTSRSPDAPLVCAPRPRTRKVRPLPVPAGTFSETEPSSVGTVSVVPRAVPTFREEFINTGYVDMFKAMEIYYDVGFDGFFIDDHVPQTFQDTTWGHRGRAFANGYIQALIESVTKQRQAAGQPPGTIRDWMPASPVTA